MIVILFKPLYVKDLPTAHFNVYNENWMYHFFFMCIYCKYLQINGPWPHHKTHTAICVYNSYNVRLETIVIV